MKVADEKKRVLELGGGLKKMGKKARKTRWRALDIAGMFLFFYLFSFVRNIILKRVLLLKVYNYILLLLSRARDED